MDSPSRGSWLDHRSPADAFGLTRFACQTAIEKEFQETTAKTLKPSTNSPAPTGQDSCRRAARIVDTDHPPERRKAWLRSMLQEIAAKYSVKSRGKSNPRGVKRKMSNFNLRCRGHPLHQIAPTVVEVIRC